MDYKLSKGSIKTLMNGGEYVNPIVQVLGNKALPGQPNGEERFRLLISDGEHLNSFALLAAHLTPVMKSGALSDNTVIKITDHIVSAVKKDRGSKRIMVILELEVLRPGSQVGMKIGNPVCFDQGC